MNFWRKSLGSSNYVSDYVEYLFCAIFRQTIFQVQSIALWQARSWVGPHRCLWIHFIVWGSKGSAAMMTAKRSAGESITCRWKRMQTTLWNTEQTSSKIQSRSPRKTKTSLKKQWRIQDFPDGGGGRLPQREGAPTYYLTNFPQKLHANKKIDPDEGRVPAAPPPPPPLDPPMQKLCF